MADEVLLRRGFKKVFWLLVVGGVGYWWLWPEVPVREWFADNTDWKYKFAFLGWCAVTVGMIYDSIVAVGKGFIAEPGTWRKT